jgi:polyhydroxyalkanoate synthesis regulator phasin
MYAKAKKKEEGKKKAKRKLKKMLQGSGRTSVQSLKPRISCL